MSFPGKTLSPSRVAKRFGSRRHARVEYSTSARTGVFSQDEEDWTVTLSVGNDSITAHPDDIEEALSRATRELKDAARSW